MSLTYDAIAPELGGQACTWGDKAKAVEFGKSVDREVAKSAIHTFSEGVKDKKIPDKISEMVRSAKRIVFLGFAYYPENMKLLLHRAPKIQVIGTAKELSPSSRKDAQERMAKGFSIREDAVQLNDITCAELLSAEAVNLVDS